MPLAPISGNRKAGMGVIMKWAVVEVGILRSVGLFFGWVMSSVSQFFDYVLELGITEPVEDAFAGGDRQKVV